MDVGQARGGGAPELEAEKVLAEPCDRAGASALHDPARERDRHRPGTIVGTELGVDTPRWIFTVSLVPPAARATSLLLSPPRHQAGCDMAPRSRCGALQVRARASRCWFPIALREHRAQRGGIVLKGTEGWCRVPLMMIGVRYAAPATGAAHDLGKPTRSHRDGQSGMHKAPDLHLHAPPIGEVSDAGSWRRAAAPRFSSGRR